MGFYEEVRDETAEPLLAEFGLPGQVAVNDPATGDPWDSQIGDEVLHDATFFRSRFTQDHNNGTLIEKGDVMFLMSTEGIAVDPELANRVVIEGTTYQVVRIDPLRPGATTLLWRVHVRK